jgi:iron complex outermembrane receptor protein
VPGEVQLRMRLNEAGRRTSELTSESQRYVVGLTGSRNGWDYDVGLNHSVNVVKDRDTHGYLLYDKLMEGIADGVINPFGPSSAAGIKLLNSIQVNDEVRHARGTMDSLDFKVSHAVGTGRRRGRAGGGWRGAPRENRLHAVGAADERQHQQRLRAEGGEATSRAQYQGGVRRTAAAVHQAMGSATVGPLRPLPGGGRRRQPESGPQLYADQDHAVPRLGRARLPRAVDDRSVPSDAGQPTHPAGPGLLRHRGQQLCRLRRRWETHRYSNPNLKPERSRQFSLGMVLQPSKQVLLSLDYWNIKRTDLIAEIGDDVMLANPPSTAIWSTAMKMA